MAGFPGSVSRGSGCPLSVDPSYPQVTWRRLLTPRATLHCLKAPLAFPQEKPTERRAGAQWLQGLRWGDQGPGSAPSLSVMRVWPPTSSWRPTPSFRPPVWDRRSERQDTQLAQGAPVPALFPSHSEEPFLPVAHLVARHLRKPPGASVRLQRVL